MNYPDSLKYLFNLGNEVTTMKLGLENISKLLDALENPQNNFLKIQVAGTNGKGSTCAFLDSICVSADIKTGLYTSPHLVSITERIKIGGQEISEEDFARHATKIREVSEKLVEVGEFETVPTFFEQVTAIALSVFAEAKIELAILETGLGGRFDATTAANAEIVAFTPIDYDHQDILGETLTKIAAEKAAIIREHTKVITAPQNSEAENVINKKCREVGIKPVRAIPNVRLVENLDSGLHFLAFTTEKTNYKVNLKMQGKHQWTNAMLAIYVAESLQDYNFKITRENIETGLENAEHKGRLEFWNNLKPSQILFDGAHNIAGAEALKLYLEEYVTKPITMIFGAMKDKDLAEIADIIFPKAENLILTKPDNLRSTETSELLNLVPKNIEIKVFETRTVTESIAKAREISSPNHLILITGSLYLVGEAQKVLKYESEI